MECVSFEALVIFDKDVELPVADAQQPAMCDQCCAIVTDECQERTMSFFAIALCHVAGWRRGVFILSATGRVYEPAGG
jgi:hypothetical protein